VLHISETPSVLSNKHKRFGALLPLNNNAHGILNKIKKKYQAMDGKIISTPTEFENSFENEAA
jgi:hypothetical protein